MVKRLLVNIGINIVMGLVYYYLILRVLMFSILAEYVNMRVVSIAFALLWTFAVASILGNSKKEKLLLLWPVGLVAGVATFAVASLIDYSVMFR